MSNSILLTLLCAEKIGLSHLVPEVNRPKVCQMFQQNLSFDDFQAFCTTFFPWFLIMLTPFVVFLDLSDSLFFQKLSYRLCPFFTTRRTPYQTFYEVSPPNPRDNSSKEWCSEEWLTFDLPVAEWQYSREITMKIT